MRLTAVSLALAAASLAACARPREYRTEDPAQAADLNGGPNGLWLNRVPAFAFEALRSPHAQSAKFTVGPDGMIAKYTVYVRREGLPDWAHKSADDILGRGEDVAYEIEVYQDGSEVYEITRRINGQLLELSVRTDGSLMYIERPLEAKDLPSPVAGAVRAQTGFTAERYAVKEAPTWVEYQVWGKKGDVLCRARIARDGHLVAFQKTVPAEFELGVRE